MTLPAEGQAERRLHDCNETGCADAKVRGFYHGLTPTQRAMVEAIVAEQATDSGRPTVASAEDLERARWEADDLRAQNTRLRRALQDIVQMDDHEVRTAARGVARTALASTALPGRDAE